MAEHSLLQLFLWTLSFYSVFSDYNDCVSFEAKAVQGIQPTLSIDCKTTDCIEHWTTDIVSFTIFKVADASNASAIAAAIESPKSNMVTNNLWLNASTSQFEKSYLRISFIVPSAEDSGTYRCDVIMKPFVGPNITVKKQTVVTLLDLRPKATSTARPTTATATITTTTTTAKTATTATATITTTTTTAKTATTNPTTTTIPKTTIPTTTTIPKTTILTRTTKPKTTIPTRTTEATSPTSTTLMFTDNVYRQYSVEIERLNLIIANLQQEIQRGEENCSRGNDVNKQIIIEFFFYAPVSYGGKKYYLSAYPFPDNVKSDNLCKVIGGYLARIDDFAEFRAVVNLYSKHSKPGTLVSGTDEEQEYQWLYQGTNETIKFTNWANGEPNNKGGSENCIVLWSDKNDMMNDTPCFINPYQFPFVCEV